METSSSPRLLLQMAVVAGVCAFLFFFGLGAIGLVGADEPRYAQIGREMLARHDWVTPVLNGKPWLEKPVLLYWNEMVSYSLFGVEDWAARVPSALYATGMVFAIFFFMRRFRPGAEMDAGLIAASLAAVIGFARGASTDMQISAPFCVAMLAWWAWNETGKRLWLGCFYALLAVGTLAKGPIAPALAVLIVAAFAGMRRDKKVFLRTIWLPGFFIEHNLERFGTNLYQHKQPFWYYIPVFLVSVLPWVVFAVCAVLNAGRSCVKAILPPDPDDQDNDDAQESDPWLPRYLLLWIAIPIVFFSISQSKLPGYILPAIPPVAVLTADYLNRRRSALGPWRLRLHALICGVLPGAAMLAPWRMLKVTPSTTLMAGIGLLTAVVAVGVVLAVRRGGLPFLRIATLVPVVLAMGFLLRPAALVIDLANSARAVAAELDLVRAPAELPLAIFEAKRDIEYGLNFYRNRPVIRYERDGIPAEAHILVAREGSGDAVQDKVGDRAVLRLGAVSQQHIELFLVSNRRTGH